MMTRQVLRLSFIYGLPCILFYFVERKHYTVMFGMCPKGVGIRVQSTMEGPKIVKISAERWNKLESGDRLLMINDDNIQDSKPENVQFLLLNLDQNEAIFTVEKEGVCMF